MHQKIIPAISFRQELVIPPVSRHGSRKVHLTVVGHKSWSESSVRLRDFSNTSSPSCHPNRSDFIFKQYLITLRKLLLVLPINVFFKVFVCIHYNPSSHSPWGVFPFTPASGAALDDSGSGLGLWTRPWNATSLNGPHSGLQRCMHLKWMIQPVVNYPKSRIEDPFLFLLEFIVMYIDSKHQWQVRLIICVRNFHKTTKSIQETARKKASALLSLRLALSHIHPYIAASQALLCYPATHATWLGTANRDPRQHGKLTAPKKSPRYQATG